MEARNFTTRTEHTILIRAGLKKHCRKDETRKKKGSFSLLIILLLHFSVYCTVKQEKVR